MQTIIKKVDENCIDESIMEEAGALLKSGALVAFPTETVYGLGANALDETASAKIYAAKGRPSDNPLIAHISSIDDLPMIVKEIPEAGRKLAEKFWPGPLTLVFPKKDVVPYGTTGGLETVAVRKSFPDGYGSEPGNLLLLPVYSLSASEFQSPEIPHLP